MSLALVWNSFLTTASLANAAAWAVLYFGGPRDPPPSKSLPPLWAGIWRARRWLCLLYVVACGIRSAWPRHDSDRVCFYDHFMSPSLIGRTLACFAELAFAALVCAALVRVLGPATADRPATALFALNFVAQTCCNYAVLTRDQRGHVIEESIWLLSGLVITVMCAAQLVRGGGVKQQNGWFLSATTVGGSAFVAFMTTVDVPMYVRRAAEDAAVNRTFSTLAEGFAEISRCATINQTDEYWTKEMPWMTGYFTVAVWISLWLGFAYVPLAQGTAGSSGADAAADASGRKKQQ